MDISDWLVILSLGLVVGIFLYQKFYVGDDDDHNSDDDYLYWGSDHHCDCDDCDHKNCNH